MIFIEKHCQICHTESIWLSNWRRRTFAKVIAVNGVIRRGRRRHCRWHVKLDRTEGSVAIVHRESLFSLCFGNYWSENNWRAAEVVSVSPSEVYDLKGFRLKRCKYTSSFHRSGLAGGWNREPLLVYNSKLHKKNSFCRVWGLFFWLLGSYL